MTETQTFSSAALLQIQKRVGFFKKNSSAALPQMIKKCDFNSKSTSFFFRGKKTTCHPPLFQSFGCPKAQLFPMEYDTQEWLFFFWEGDLHG